MTSLRRLSFRSARFSLGSWTGSWLTLALREPTPQPVNKDLASAGSSVNLPREAIDRGQYHPCFGIDHTEVAMLAHQGHEDVRRAAVRMYRGTVSIGGRRGGSISHASEISHSEEGVLRGQYNDYIGLASFIDELPV